MIDKCERHIFNCGQKHVNNCDEFKIMDMLLSEVQICLSHNVYHPRVTGLSNG